MTKKKRFLLYTLAIIVLVVGCVLIFGKKTSVQQNLSADSNKPEVVPEVIKTNFTAKELSSKYLNGNVITNPTPDFKGIVSFGPYTPMYSGNHTVTVNYKLTKNYRAFVDVARDKGKTVMQRIELPHNTDSFKFEFSLDEYAKDLEVRFFCEPMEKIDKRNKFKLFGISFD